MQLISTKHLLIGACMVAAAALALGLKPTTKVADSAPTVDLEVLIPEHFGDWTIDTSIVPLIADPSTTAMINKIYSQTLTRTYVDSKDNRVMLSIAYGGEQSDAMAVHKPEVCYPAQGFQILKNSTGTLSTGTGNIPVKRLVASLGNRVEPITYWTTLGDTVAVNGIKWKLNQLKYGLTGKIPDGLLFRISTIQNNTAAAYKVQDDFSRDLIGALDARGKERLIGKQLPAN